MDDWPSIAAANNAEWCDVFCRGHGMQTRLDVQAWTSRTRTPPFYPDAVTLTPEVGAGELLKRIDASVGCSVKDSFASLDLAPHGFDVLFDAHWVISTALPAGPSGHLRWEVIDGREALAEWEAAWATDGVETGSFPVGMLEHERITVLAGRYEHRVVAGAVLNRGSRVVGFTNVFASPDHRAVGRSDGLAFAARLYPGARFCGYESGSELVETLRLGFETVGALRVWIRGDRPGHSFPADELDS